MMGAPSPKSFLVDNWKLAMKKEDLPIEKKDQHQWPPGGEEQQAGPSLGAHFQK